MSTRMPFYGCRTCFSNEKGNKLVNVTQKCWLEKTIKDLIIRIVPEMKSTIDDEDFACKKCISIMKIAMAFIETCLEGEIVLADKKAKLQINNDDDFWQDEEEGNIFDNEKNEDEISPDPPTCDTANLDHDYCVNNSPKLLSELLFPVLSYQNDENSSDAGDLEENNKYMSRNMPKPQVSCNENDEDSIEYNDVRVKDASDIKKNVQNMENTDVLINFKNNEDNSTFETTNGLQENKYNRERKSQHARHKKLHEAKKEKDSFICEICGKLFKKSVNLEMHKESHTSGHSYVCDKCPKNFKTKRRVLVHIRRVHAISNQCQCDECGKILNDKSTLKKHKRLVHFKDKPFVCSICNKVFGRKDYVQKHMTVHTGILTKAQAASRKGAKRPKYGISLRDPGKPVPCKVCGKILANVHLLKLHLETHIKLRRFKCKFCSIAFNSRRNCVKHQKYHAENKIRCDICYKRLETEEELAHHVSLHGKRPPRHSCNICGEKFHRKYLLDNHYTIQHLPPDEIRKTEEEIICKNLLEYAIMVPE